MPLSQLKFSLQTQWYFVKNMQTYFSTAKESSWKIRSNQVIEGRLNVSSLQILHRKIFKGALYHAYLTLFPTMLVNMYHIFQFNFILPLLHAYIKEVIECKCGKHVSKRRSTYLECQSAFCDCCSQKINGCSWCASDDRNTLLLNDLFVSH
jgi:hypothetical protein